MLKPSMACACFLLGACASVPREFAGTDRHDRLITEGEAFGVQIGADRDRAMLQLKLKLTSFRFIYTNCLHADYMHDNKAVSEPVYGSTTCSEITEDVYHATIGLLGYANIFVDSSAGHVVRLKWGRGKGYIG